MAYSVNELCSHRDRLINHFQCLGLLINLYQPAEKLASADAMYSISGRESDLYCYARPPVTGAYSDYHELARDVQRRQAFSSKELMAAGSMICCLGLLYMWPLQLWVKESIPIHAWNLGSVHLSLNLAHQPLSAFSLSEPIAGEDPPYVEHTRQFRLSIQLFM